MSGDGLKNPSSETTSDIFSNRVKYLFQQFLIIYDEKWADKISTPNLLEEKSRLWGSATKNLTNEQMRRGLNQATKKCAWPPSIAEFLEFCEEPVIERTHHEAYKEFIGLALPKKPDKEIANRELNKIFSMLGVKRKDGKRAS